MVIKMILDNNKRVLEEKFPFVMDELKEEKGDVSINVEYKTARDGAFFLEVMKDNEKIRLNSAYRPLQEAEKWASQFNYNNLDINVLVFGLGNGLFVREILKRLDKKGNVIIWEPNLDLFRYVIEKEDIADILDDERVNICFHNIEEDGFRGALVKWVNWSNIPTQIICEHPGYEKIYSDECDLFYQKIKEINSMEKIQRDTNANFAHIAVDNMIHNFKYMKESKFICDFIGKLPEDLTAIIVAAGPSLEKNYMELKRAEGKALIFAVDTAIRFLEEKGIAYDCAVTIDPNKPTHYFTDAPNSKNVPLFCGPESKKDIMEFHTGQKIWYRGDIYYGSLFSIFGKEFPEYSVGGSVATSAFSLAQTMGIKKIVLVGQDLAYEGEHTHVGNEKSEILNEEATIEMVDGIYGNPVRTRGDWVIYRDWFERMIKTYPELQVIDATEGGALIHGSKVMKLSEVVDEISDTDFSFDKILSDISPTFTQEQYSQVKEVIEHLEKELLNIKRKSFDGQLLCNQFRDLMKTNDQKKRNKIVKELLRVNDYICNQAGGYEILEIYTADLVISTMKNINQVSDDKEQDELDLVEYADTIYGGYLEAIQEILPIMREVLDTL